MYGYNPEIEQDIRAAADEGMRFAVSIATLGFGIPPEANREGMASIVEVVPVVEEPVFDELRSLQNAVAAPRLGGLTLAEVNGAFNATRPDFAVAA